MVILQSRQKEVEIKIVSKDHFKGPLWEIRSTGIPPQWLDWKWDIVLILQNPSHEAVGINTGLCTGRPRSSESRLDLEAACTHILVSQHHSFNTRETKPLEEITTVQRDEHLLECQNMRTHSVENEKKMRGDQRDPSGSQPEKAPSKDNLEHIKPEHMHHSILSQTIPCSPIQYASNFKHLV